MVYFSIAALTLRHEESSYKRVIIGLPANRHYARKYSDLVKWINE
jgi:hypothetical protein